MQWYETARSAVECGADGAVCVDAIYGSPGGLARVINQKITIVVGRAISMPMLVDSPQATLASANGDIIKPGRGKAFFNKEIKRCSR